MLEVIQHDIVYSVLSKRHAQWISVTAILLNSFLQKIVRESDLSSRHLFFNRSDRSKSCWENNGANQSFEGGNQEWGRRLSVPGPDERKNSNKVVLNLSNISFSL